MRGSYNAMSGGSRYSHQMNTVDQASLRAKEAAEEAVKKSRKPFLFCSKRYGLVIVGVSLLAL